MNHVRMHYAPVSTKMADASAGTTPAAAAAAAATPAAAAAAAAPAAAPPGAAGDSGSTAMASAPAPAPVLAQREHAHNLEFSVHTDAQADVLGERCTCGIALVVGCTRMRRRMCWVSVGCGG